MNPTSNTLIITILNKYFLNKILQKNIINKIDKVKYWLVYTSNCIAQKILENSIINPKPDNTNIKFIKHAIISLMLLSLLVFNSKSLAYSICLNSSNIFLKSPQ